MLERDPSELELAGAFRAYLEDAPTEVRPVELAHRFTVAYPHGRTTIVRMVFARAPAIAWALLLAGLLLALVVGALAVGAWPRNQAVVVAPRPPAWAEPNVAALPDATVSKLQAQLDGLVSGLKVTGLSAAVVSPAGSWAGAAGVDAAGTAIQPTSAFAITNITETFVGAEVLLLASGGKVDLDAPVTTYVTLPFATNDATIRQLATMTSGFPDLPDAILAKQVAKDLSHAWTAAELVALAKDEPRQGIVGGPGSFNGFNYVVLGMVIEKVTGEPLVTVLRRDLLASAGLDRLWMQPAEKPQPPLTVAVDRTDGKVVDPASGYLPSLALASTGQGGAGVAADAPSLARWGYRLYGGRIISDDLVATMTTQVTDTTWGAYGFGTFVADIDGRTVVGYPGDSLQYSSILLVWPSTRTAVVVLAPAPGKTTDYTLPDCALGLYQQLLGG